MVYDPSADLAVLHAPALPATPLPLATAPAGNGSPVVILGYPHGGPLSAVPATVVQRLPLLQPGIATSLGLREVYRLHAEVRHGDSGSPLLNEAGQVTGVVNAVSLISTDSGFAVTLDSLRPDLATATGTTTAVGTGNCGTPSS